MQISRGPQVQAPGFKVVNRGRGDRGRSLAGAARGGVGGGVGGGSVAAHNIAPLPIWAVKFCGVVLAA